MDAYVAEFARGVEEYEMLSQNSPTAAYNARRIRRTYIRDSFCGQIQALGPSQIVLHRRYELG